MIRVDTILFPGKGWSLPLDIHVSTLFREAPLKWQGILQLLPKHVYFSFFNPLKVTGKLEIESIGRVHGGKLGDGGETGIIHACDKVISVCLLV